MKKKISLALIICLAYGLAACGSIRGNSNISERAAEKASGEASVHKIGVLVYSRTDNEVIDFKDYLENYIENCFEDVDFLYSDTVASPEEEMQFIRSAAENGVEGIMSFNSYDLEA